MSTALEDLLVRHVETGTIQGAVALLGGGDDVVAPGWKPPTYAPRRPAVGNSPPGPAGAPSG